MEGKNECIRHPSLAKDKEKTARMGERGACRGAVVRPRDHKQRGIIIQYRKERFGESVDQEIKTQRRKKI
jgi:hypothetical protein